MPVPGDGDVGDGGGGELPGVSEATQAGTSVAARAGASVAVKGGASVLTKVLVAAGAVAVGGGGFQAGRVYESAAIAERTAVAASAERTVVPQERPEPSPVAVPVPVLDEPSPAIAAPPPAVAQPRPAARPAVVHRAPEAQPEPLPTDEPNLLDAALRAMRGGQSTRALEITAEHRRLHPNGVLAQEREVIAIEALIRLGRDADAHAAADRFRDAYPTSGHLLRVDSLWCARWSPDLCRLPAGLSASASGSCRRGR